MRRYCRTSCEPHDDPDSDGWTNAQEAAAGTDPFDATPPLGHLQPETEHIPATIGEVVRVSWPTFPGKHYTLLASFDLSADSWIPVEEPILGNGNIFEFNIPQPSENTTFWKVAVADVDSDGDTVTNAEEHQMFTNAFLRDSDGDGMDDNVDPEPNSGVPSLQDADGDGIPDEDDLEPNLRNGAPPSISAGATNLRNIVNVAAEDPITFLIDVRNPDGPSPADSDLKLFVSGTEDNADFSLLGGNRFAVTWTARIHDS